MKEISILDILILNCIVYTNDFCKKELSKNIIGLNVYQFSKIFKYSIYDNGKLPGEISKKEFDNIIKTVHKRSKIFKSIKILDIENNICGNKNGTDRVVNVLFSYFDTLIFVFKGTSGSLEWVDNAIGACENVTDTQQQIAALKYFDDSILKFSKYKNIIVSGHSKGGNKAKYIAIMRGNLDSLKRIYSFDGQGFNKYFLKKYKDEIIKYKNKIIDISNEYDFVNILLFPISKTNVYIKSNTSFGEKSSIKKQITHRYGGFHSPYSMFKESNGILKINDIVEQSEIMKNMNEFLNFFAINMSESDNRFLYYTLTTYMIKEDLKFYKELDMKIPNGFFKRLVILIKEFNKKKDILSFIEIIGLLKPFFEDFGSNIVTNVFRSKGKKYLFTKIYSKLNNEKISFIERLKDEFDYSEYIDKISVTRFHFKNKLKNIKYNFKKIVKVNINKKM